MASPTKKVKVRREIAKGRAGKLRKNQTRLLGSTQPGLPLNKPNANERAQHSK